MTTETYRSEFEDLRQASPGGQAAWHDDLRARAFDQFARDGFPGAKVEEWKYADVSALEKQPFRAATKKTADVKDAIARTSMPSEGYTAVLVNGHFRPELSDLDDLPEGVTVTGFATALAERPDWLRERFADPTKLREERLSGRDNSRPYAMVAMNTAFASDGIVVHLAENAATEVPIHVFHFAAPESDHEMIHTRNLFVADAGSSGLIVETHAAAEGGAYFTNSVAEVRASDDAHLRHYRLQDESDEAFHLSTVLAHLAKESAYDNFVLSTGAAFSRNEIRAVLEGPFVHCRLNGAYLGREGQRMDNWLRVDHRAPNGTVSETYKGVLTGNARGSFQGKIRVDPDAQKTDARQLNKNLLLSPDAQADSKPELEILADDVRCSHGSTVGDIDEDALFYLRARGIEEEQARNLLIEAFVGELIDVIGYGPAHDYFRAAFEEWLRRLDRKAVT